MNLLHLKYAVEVDKTRSINKAAENLYMGQPNLSRAIKELEESLGITIFKRTSKGIIPTPKGEEFLEYAKSILAQVDEMEALYNKKKKGKQEFNISVPRASYITLAFCAFVNTLDQTQEIEVNYKETNALKAINNILQADYNLGIIRYKSVFEPYFANLMNEKGLKSEEIWEFRHHIIMSEGHPLAYKENITYDDLSNYTEIAHGDPYVPFVPASDVKKEEFPDFINKRIFVFERGSQFDLLYNVPSTYMWVSPMPKNLIVRNGLVERVCVDDNHLYKDVLIYKKNYRLTELDRRFIIELKKVRDELQNHLINK
jgi:DNA-binding transcriptional LysR family regulator